ncbi:hypothetical protein C5612_02625 [Pseudomonas frederiksbergensis]|uniref:Uncharacterized protein n=1 Tax=Pseudomonas frederiksbergensis TaxID=104087 RepID=A0A2S8HW44_9PSED|nr:hypothetical protein C5612_02625 [Pseudomonas frederiksbergensis]
MNGGDDSGFCPLSRQSANTQNPVGAGLLANAECQSTSMLNVQPPSRASPLPQVHQRPLNPGQKKARSR